MRSGTMIRWAASSACLVCALIPSLPTPARAGDEPSRLGRFFRLGAASDPSKTSNAPTSNPTLGSTSNSNLISTGSNSSAAQPYRSLSDAYSPPALSTAPSTPTGAGNLTPSPRITPKARNMKPITEADPLVSRISVGRADSGSQFGMFMEVFADGTIIDGEGVHKVSADVLKPVVEAVSSNEFAKLKGHCGGPAGDTFENIHVVTYERAYGRLRANAFSYSGNPQGCDHAVHHLHKILDDLQMKLSTPGAANASATTSVPPTVVSPPTMSMAPTTTVPSSLPAPAPMGTAGTMPMPNLPDPGLH